MNICKNQQKALVLHKELTFLQKNSGMIVHCKAILPDAGEVCKCQIYTNNLHNVWTISSWFTKTGYSGQGIGRSTLQEILEFLVERYGAPDKIEYIWNGENKYVLDWLTEHFDAACTCPIAIQKTQPDDDWLSHMYNLNVSKVLSYFKINKEQLMER